MMMDRVKAPAFKMPETIELHPPDEQKLDNGIPVYFLNAGTQELVKIELIYQAGIWHQGRILQANACNSLITEGTSRLTGMEIAEKLDFYGAFLQSDTEKDLASVCLYSLNKHLKDTIPLFHQVITDAQYPGHEFDIYIRNFRQSFQVNSEKVEALARRTFSTVVFGQDHPYGKITELHHFEELSRAQVIDFYEKYYTADNCTIIVSGKIPEDMMGILNQYFGQIPSGTRYALADKEVVLNPARENRHYVEKKGAVQSSIRIGRPLFLKTHPDFHGMYILNTVLGGYFGSRLMANIREDKGYTYGIGSGVVSFQHAGYFFISTEVGAEVVEKALDEIYFEMTKLRQETVPSQELLLVKNYLMGEFIRSMDGPFSQADRLKSLIFFDLDYSFYQQFILAVREINAEQLMELANKYLIEENMFEVIAGNIQQ